MGVTVLYPYIIPEGRTNSQAMDYLSKRILALGAKHSGQFMVDCETYMTAPQHGPSKIVYILHNTECPVSTFAVLDTGTGKHIPLIADSLFDLIIIKMTAVNPNKKQTRIESKGARFEYGDFIIKLGSVTMMENFKGILIELEYRASLIFYTCSSLIRQMLEMVTGVSVPKEFCTYFTPQSMLNVIGQQQIHSKENDIYEIIDTLNQYLEHFTNYRKQSSLPQGQMSMPATSTNRVV